MITNIKNFIDCFNSSNQDVKLVNFAGRNLYHTECNGKPDFRLAINFIESEGHNDPVWFDLAERNYALLHQKGEPNKFKYGKTLFVLLINEGPKKGCYVIDTREKNSNIKTEVTIPEGLKKLNFVLSQVKPERRLNGAGVWRCYLQKSAVLGYYFSIGKANSENKVPVKKDNTLCSNSISAICTSMGIEV